MTKKKTLTLVASIVLALALALGMVLPVFAANYSESTTVGTNARASITKQLRMPRNTTIPNVTFTFTFTKVGINDSTNTAGMPTITPVTITFPDQDQCLFTEGDNQYAVEESDDFVPAPSVWTAAGVYKYQVEEAKTGFASTGAVNEGWAYSDAKYNIEFWVESDGQGGFYVKYVSAILVTGYIDEYYTGTPGGAKVDPTPGGKDQHETHTILDDHSQMIFTNRYWKSNGGGPDNPEVAALEVIKLVTGNGAEKDVYFKFNVKVIQPSVINTGTQSYRAYVLDETGANVTDTANYAVLGTDPVNGKYIQFTSGTALTQISLLHGQRLVFVDLHVGSKVEVEEAAAPGYQPTYKRTFAGTGEFKGSVGQSYGFPGITHDTVAHYTEDGVNKATFTNIRSGATPGGISVDNLPYLALIGVGLVALASFVVIKVRKRAANNA